MVVMDVFTRRIIGFGVAPADLDGPVICRMFNRTIAKQKPPKSLSSDNDPTVSLSSVACEPSYTGSC
jgi:putative transposase